MTRLRSRRPRSPSKQDARSASTPQNELAELKALGARQQSELDETATTLSQAIARIAHSERTLSQAKTKLLAAEGKLSALEARLQQAEAKLVQSEAKLGQAEAERERATAELLRLRDALAAALEREPALQRAEAALRCELENSRLEVQRALANAAVLGESLAAVELLAMRVTRIVSDASRNVAGVPSVEGVQERATIKPAPSLPEPNRSCRRSTGPEIVVDGMPLVP